MLDPDVKKQRAISPADFVTVVRDQPADFFRTLLSDAINLAGNTGVSMVYGRYLGLFDLREDSESGMFKWRDIRDRHGILAMLAYMGRTAPVTLVLNVGFVVLWGAMLVIAILGAVRFLFDGTREVALRLLFAGVPLYIFTFTFVSGSVRWDHRSPMEFVICLFFGMGITMLLSLRNRENSQLSASVFQ